MRYGGQVYSVRRQVGTGDRSSRYAGKSARRGTGLVIWSGNLGQMISKNSSLSLKHSSFPLRTSGMRKPRQLVPGARYHVTARVNHQDRLLDDDASKALFLDTLKRAKVKYSFAVENFTLMGNHYHLLIRPLGGESLPRIMRWIMGVFAMAYNRIHGLVGHFWQGRYRSRVVDSLRSFLETFGYIDEIPVKAGLADKAWAWVFGGLHHHRSSRADIVSPLEPVTAYWFPSHGIRRLR